MMYLKMRNYPVLSCLDTEHSKQTNKQTKMLDQHGAKGCDEDDIGDDDGDDIGHDGDNDGGLTFEVGDVSSC